MLPRQQYIPIVTFVPSTSSSPTVSNHPQLINDPGMINICPHGPSCKDYNNCKNLHPCPYGNECRKLTRVLSNTSNMTDLGHCRKCFHLCPQGKNCKLINDQEHVELFMHSCNHGRKCICTSMDHKVRFRHVCKYGDKCRSLSGKFDKWDHYVKFTHPMNEDVVHNIPKDLHFLFTNEKKSDSLTSNHSMSTVGQHCDINGLTIVNKHSLLAQVKNRERSAKFEIDSINGKSQKSYHFIGYEKGQGNTSTANVVCFKKTEKGVFGGHIKTVPESSCAFPTSGKIHQPWYHEKVTVYSNSVISQVFDEILKQQLNGVSPSCSYIEVMEYMIKQHGIPVFIVGGAVRDVIREVIGDKKTNASQIMKGIKDIDIGFGCDPHTFSNLLSSKYRKGVQTPGPRGLVQVGSTSTCLFLEGKAINGLNNDNRSVKTEISQCYGTNLRGENICRDFTCNSLWYDPINKCIIDTFGNGQGIKDSLSKTLRIPVKEAYWSYWANGNPSKLMRYYKFILKGYTPADSKTSKFIIDTITSGKFTDSDLEVRNQYVKGIGVSFKTQLVLLLKKDFGDSFYNSFFAKHFP